MNSFTAILYSEQRLEASPLNRLMERGALGAVRNIDVNSDSDYTIKFGNQTNMTDEVKQINISLTSDYIPSFQSASREFYEAGELFKTFEDFNWQPGQLISMDHTIEECKDKPGRVILKRTYNSGEPNDTFYVYDNFGRFTYVIPPKLDISNGVSEVEFDGIHYQYKYNFPMWLVEKGTGARGMSIPGSPS